MVGDAMIKDEVEKVERTSPDIVNEHVEQLKAIFPEVFSEGKVDFEKLKAALGDIVDSQPEKYSFTWAGKRNSIQLLQTPSYATLTPSKEESISFDSTQNLFIEGDNLEVLKLLHKSYSGQVKMIYMDPPYNTGNDFVYPDDFADPLETYLKITGQKDASGNLLTSNPETSGRYHSTWLSMMYPRLYLARQLLSDDGVILISIDDHEVHNLSMLMSEIFGEDGYLSTFVWRRRIGSSLASSWVSTDHEYVLAYSKRPEEVYVRGDERDMAKYNISDGKGRFYASMPVTVGMTKFMRPNQWYELKNPKTGTGYWPPEGRVWAYIPPTMREKILNNKIIWPEDYPNKKLTSPRLVSYPEDAKRDRKPITSWVAEKNSKNTQDEDEAYSMTSAKNEEGTRILKELLGGETSFNYPKPLSLLKSLVEQFTKDNDIVLDCFAGSSTMAQAVLEMNSEDGANRRFIMVQLPEPTGNKDYPTIAEVGKERIRRVIQRMSQEDEKRPTLFPLEKPEDLGFRVFKLASSTYKKWHGIESNNAEAYAKQLAMFTDPLVENWIPDNLLWEVAIKEGYGLNTQVQRLNEVKGNTIWKMNDPDKDQSMLVCLDDELETSTLAALPLTRDHVFVCLNKALNDTIAANLALQCRLKKI